jgi:hypothetical protein
MAHLPGSTPANRDGAAPRVAEADPNEVGQTLSRFYGGVHRATEETDDDLQKVT